jgi:DNA-binding NtrC family response regulator
VQSALLLDSDLFFSVKITETLRHVGVQTRTVRRLDDFVRALAADPPLLALVNTAPRDRSWALAIAAAHDAGIQCIAYGPHVDVATQEAARRAGATRVLSNAALGTMLPRVALHALRAARREEQQSSSPNPGLGTTDETDTLS